MPMMARAGQAIIFSSQLQFIHALLGLGLLVIRAKLCPREGKAQDQRHASSSRGNELQKQSANVLGLCKVGRCY
jgi:hypothetical protein